MQVEATSHLPKINPNVLGALDESAPLAQGPTDLFTGEEHYLRKGPRRKRLALWRRISRRVASLLEPDENVLHVLPAVQRVTFLQQMGLGWLAYKYNQVALVLTDRRLIEVALDFKGEGPDEQARSYPWRTLEGVRMRFGSLVVKPLAGKKQAWSVRVGGDRKLLKQLLPRVEGALLTRDAGGVDSCPVLHCPACNQQVEAKDDHCASCNVSFRSRKMTAGLSLAFPGAGLYYAGHPVLGTFDLIGEVMVFCWFAFLLAFTTGPMETGVLLLMGGFFLLLTKVESLHVGHVLVSRLRTEPAGNRERWSKLAKVGSFASLAALASLFLVAGQLAGTVDKDLDFSEAIPYWSGSRDTGEWTMFADDPTMRSEWSHEDGWTVSVFAYPLGPGEEADDFRDQFLLETEMEGNLADEVVTLSGGHQGFRALQEYEDEDGSLYTFINYFVYDLQGRDVHQLLSVVPQEYSEEGEEQLEELLNSATWIDAIPPF